MVLPAIVLAEIGGSGTVRGYEGGRQERIDRRARAREWIESRNFVVAELTGLLARDAVELAITHNLKGSDATVLATAVKHNCTHLFTRDSKLVACSLDALVIAEVNDSVSDGKLFAP